MFGFVLALIVVLVVIDSFSDVPLIVPTRTCPTSELTPARAEQITKEAQKRLFNEEHSEHYRTSDLVEEMPKLRRAALAGNRDAQHSYAGVLIALGIVQQVGLPDGTTLYRATQDGMMFHILAVHRGAPIDEGEEEKIALQLRK